MQPGIWDKERNGIRKYGFEFSFPLPDCVISVTSFILLNAALLSLSRSFLSTSQIIYVCWDRVMSDWPWTCYAAADDPELCPLSVCWGYRHVPPCPVYIVLRTESRFTAWSSGMLGKHSTNPPTSPAFHWVFIGLQMCVYVSVYKINCHSKFYNKDFHA